MQEIFVYHGIMYHGKINKTKMRGFYFAESLLKGGPRLIKRSALLPKLPGLKASSGQALLPRLPSEHDHKRKAKTHPLLRPYYKPPKTSQITPLLLPPKQPKKSLKSQKKAPIVVSTTSQKLPAENKTREEPIKMSVPEIQLPPVTPPVVPKKEMSIPPEKTKPIDPPKLPTELVLEKPPEKKLQDQAST